MDVHATAQDVGEHAAHRAGDAVGAGRRTGDLDSADVYASMVLAVSADCGDVVHDRQRVYVPERGDRFGDPEALGHHCVLARLHSASVRRLVLVPTELCEGVLSDAVEAALLAEFNTL